jgi:hypothetical protein
MVYVSKHLLFLFIDLVFSILQIRTPDDISPHALISIRAPKFYLLQVINISMDAVAQTCKFYLKLNIRVLRKDKMSGLILHEVFAFIAYISSDHYFG